MYHLFNNLNKVLYSKKISSAKNFVKSDRQAVRQEFIFVKRRIARFVFGRSVRLLIVYLHIHEYFWLHTCCFAENLVRNYFSQKIALTKATKLNSWRKFPALQYTMKSMIIWLFVRACVQ